MGDQQAPIDDVVSNFDNQRFIVAWKHEGDQVVCVKPAAGTDGELIDVADVVDYMAEHGFMLGYAPGGSAADPQYQFKRR